MSSALHPEQHYLSVHLKEEYFIRTKSDDGLSEQF